MKNSYSKSKKYNCNDDIILVSNSETESEEDDRSSMSHHKPSQKDSNESKKKTCTNIFAQIKNKNELNSNSRFSRKEPTNLSKTAGRNTVRKGSKCENPSWFQSNSSRNKRQRESHRSSSAEGSSSVEIEQVESDSDNSPELETTKRGKVPGSDLSSCSQLRHVSQKNSDLLRSKSVNTSLKNSDLFRSKSLNTSQTNSDLFRPKSVNTSPKDYDLFMSKSLNTSNPSRFKSTKPDNTSQKNSDLFMSKSLNTSQKHTDPFISKSENMSHKNSDPFRSKSTQLGKTSQTKSNPSRFKSTKPDNTSQTNSNLSRSKSIQSANMSQRLDQVFGPKIKTYQKKTTASGLQNILNGHRKHGRSLEESSSDSEEENRKTETRKTTAYQKAKMCSPKCIPDSNEETDSPPILSSNDEKSGNESESTQEPDYNAMFKLLTGTIDSTSDHENNVDEHAQNPDLVDKLSKLPTASTDKSLDGNFSDSSDSLPDCSFLSKPNIREAVSERSKIVLESSAHKDVSVGKPSESQNCGSSKKVPQESTESTVLKVQYNFTNMSSNKSLKSQTQRENLGGSNRSLNIFEKIAASQRKILPLVSDSDVEMEDTVDSDVTNLRQNKGNSSSNISTGRMLEENQREEPKEENQSKTDGNSVIAVLSSTDTDEEFPKQRNFCEHSKSMDVVGNACREMPEKIVEAKTMESLEPEEGTSSKKISAKWEEEDDNDVTRIWSYTPNVYDDDVIEVFDSDDEDAVFCLSQVPIYIKQEPVSDVGEKEDDEDGEKDDDDDDDDNDDIEVSTMLDEEDDGPPLKVDRMISWEANVPESFGGAADTHGMNDEDRETENEEDEDPSTMLDECRRVQSEEEEDEPLLKDPGMKENVPESIGQAAAAGTALHKTDYVGDDDFSDEDIFSDSNLLDKLEKDVVDKQEVKKMVVDPGSSVSGKSKIPGFDREETGKEVLISDQDKKEKCEVVPDGDYKDSQMFSDEDNDDCQMFSDDDLYNDLTNIDSSIMLAIKQAEVVPKASPVVSSSEDEFYNQTTQVDGFNSPGKITPYSNLKEKIQTGTKRRTLSLKNSTHKKRKRVEEADVDEIARCFSQSSSDEDESVSVQPKVRRQMSFESENEIDKEVSYQCPDQDVSGKETSTRSDKPEVVKKSALKKMNDMKKIVSIEARKTVEVSERQEKEEEPRNQDKESNSSFSHSKSSTSSDLISKTSKSSTSSSAKHSSSKRSSSKHSSSKSSKNTSSSSSRPISAEQSTKISLKSKVPTVSTSKEREAKTSTFVPQINKKSSSSRTKPSVATNPSKSTTSFYKKNLSSVLPVKSNTWLNKGRLLPISPKKKRVVKKKKDAEEPMSFTQKISNARKQMKHRKSLPNAPKIPTAKNALVKKKNELDELENSDVQLPNVDDIIGKQLPIMSFDVNQVKRNKELEQNDHKPADKDTTSKLSDAKTNVNPSKTFAIGSVISNQTFSHKASNEVFNMADSTKGDNSKTDMPPARLSEKCPANAKGSSLENSKLAQFKTDEKTKKAKVETSGPNQMKAGKKDKQGITQVKKSANQFLLDELLSKQELFKRQASVPSTSCSTVTKEMTANKNMAASDSSNTLLSRPPSRTLNPALNSTSGQQNMTSNRPPTSTVTKNNLNLMSKSSIEPRRILEPIALTAKKNNINLMSKSSIQPVVSRTLEPKTSAVERILTMDDFHRIVLRWNPMWWQEHAKFRKMSDASNSKNAEKKDNLPPILGNNEKGLFPLLESYSNIQDYQRIMLNLLAYETWESVSKDWGANNITFNVGLERVHKPERGDEFVIVEWLGILPQHLHRNYPREMDLLRIDVCGQYLRAETPQGHTSTMTRNESSALTRAPTLGLVQHVDITTKNDKGALKARAPSLEKEELMKSREVTAIRLVTKMKFRKFCLNPNYLAKVQFLTNLITTQRQISALVYFPKSPLHRDILKPGSKQVYCHQVTSRQLENEFDPSQSSAICSIVRAIQQPPVVPKICILQGPPGTGKSHTIIGLLKKIIHGQGGGSQCRVCLATPSNAAVDELMRRLVLDKEKTRQRNKDAKTIDFVRVGSSSKIDQDLRSYCLDDLVGKKCNSVLEYKQKENIPESVKQDLKRLEDRIAKWKTELQSLREKSDTLKAENCFLGLKKLLKEQKNLQSSLPINKNIVLSGKDKHNLKREILLNADVLCGTLSSFGNPQIIKILKSNPNRRNEHFTCAIIDESSQAAELDTLIPLQYGMSKLILVGDPEQLPATVLSQKAEQMNFGRSLLQRLYNYFKDNDESAIQLLKTQYRMDAKIFQFPNKLIYNDQLTTHKSVEHLSEKFPLVPYLVFDMIDGRETTKDQSICNRTEATCTVQLCDVILKDTKLNETHIGIICPYQTQKALVLQLLREKHLSKIDVDTVDGFQGREKLVIILNCVRSHSATGGIGFLADRRRMNVAITRAKSALYILGNLSSLQKSGDWRLLIDDAKYRKRIIPVNSQSEFLSQVTKCFKPRRELKLAVKE